MMLLSPMELNRWRRARLFLLDTIEGLSYELRAERSAVRPSSDKIKTLEQQIEILSDVRYHLTPHDQDRLQSILRGQIDSGDVSFCLAVRKQLPTAQSTALPSQSCTNSCAECRRHTASCGASDAIASA